MKVTVVGGCGRVGLPFALHTAACGLATTALDADERRVQLVASGRSPFRGAGLDGALQFARDNSLLWATSEVAEMRDSDVIVVAVPVPFERNPPGALSEARPNGILSIMKDIAHRTSESSLILIRSTLAVGCTADILKDIRDLGSRASIAYCPERSLEGQSLQEIRSVPQLIGADDDDSARRASSFFKEIGIRAISLDTREAEFAKLFGNAWRYAQFALANQAWRSSERLGIDFHRIRTAMSDGYSRAADIPLPGLVGGPCLPKDTEELHLSTSGIFSILREALLENQSLPLYIVQTASRMITLEGSTIGILGASFKAGSDDVRASLSTLLQEILVARGARVITSDPYVRGPGFVSVNEVIARSDLIIIATPHDQYSSIEVNKPVIDPWGTVVAIGSTAGPI